MIWIVFFHRTQASYEREATRVGVPWTRNTSVLALSIAYWSIRMHISMKLQQTAELKYAHALANCRRGATVCICHHYWFNSDAILRTTQSSARLGLWSICVHANVFVCALCFYCDCGWFYWRKRHKHNQNANVSLLSRSQTHSCCCLISFLLCVVAFRFSVFSNCVVTISIRTKQDAK